MEMALRVSEDLIDAFAAREQISLLKDPIKAASLSLDQSSMQSSHLTPIVGVVLKQKFCSLALSANRCMTEIGRFTGEPTALIYPNVPSQPGSSIDINSRLGSHPVSPSPLQMDSAAVPTSISLPQIQLIVKVVANINLKMLPTARELEHPLQHEANR